MAASSDQAHEGHLAATSPGQEQVFLGFDIRPVGRINAAGLGGPPVVVKSSGRRYSSSALTLAASRLLTDPAAVEPCAGRCHPAGGVETSLVKRQLQGLVTDVDLLPHPVESCGAVAA